MIKAFEGFPTHWGALVWKTVVFLACTAGPAFSLVTWLIGKRHATR